MVRRAETTNKYTLSCVVLCHFCLPAIPHQPIEEKRAHCVLHCCIAHANSFALSNRYTHTKAVRYPNRHTHIMVTIGILSTLRRYDPLHRVCEREQTFNGEKRHSWRKTIRNPIKVLVRLTFARSEGYTPCVSVCVRAYWWASVCTCGCVFLRCVHCYSHRSMPCMRVLISSSPR